MNAKVKSLLIVAGKNAVNAAILASSQMIHDPSHNNFHTAAGLRGIAWMITWAVLVREGTVWVPKLLAWSANTGGQA